MTPSAGEAPRFRGINALTPRRLFAAGAVVCSVLIGVALYFEYVMRLEPCPLCMVQRVLVVLLALVMAAAAFRNPRGWGMRACGAMIALLGLAGAAVAGRHVYLQGLPPDQVPECGPGLGYILDAFPLGEAIGLILKGSGECAEVQWAFLGLTIPGWTLVVFVGFSLAGILLCAIGWPASRRAPHSGGVTESQ